ncbi:hypothetical protein EW026_g6464 [Hermanssonia centrifuga]|uniref:Helicase C-terminal domain-containing protein n=1 Tax=Hermanssonia centrifuga TaxID=98765 RepID=A0A4V3X9R2_9APHY|nr:hypothetical protein EW026_g6464 [Hermanssonia centrifuga]
MTTHPYCYGHWDDFNNYIAKIQLEDAPLAGLRAQEVLKPLLLRRTKDAKLSREEEAAEDRALAMGDAGDKELARADKITGSKWVADIKQKFLDRAIAAQQDYDDDELEGPEENALFVKRNLRFDGSMDREAREAVLSQFRKSGGPKVILISTKCGGVGLNLTSANRIINLDLSWKYASESQAYNRVHRLATTLCAGLKSVNRLRMLKLQDTKTGLAEAALGEGTGVKLHKLSVKELKALFGLSKDNAKARASGRSGRDLQR